VNPNFQAAKAENPQRRTQAENREYRRTSLLEAAIATVAKHDITGATVERICAQAGASRGLIAHYFDSKEELLLAALTSWFDLALGIKKQIAGSQNLSAEEKIHRIAYSSFDNPSYSWETAAAWQAFTNASRHNQAYAKPIRNASRYSNAITEPLFREAALDRRIELDARKAAVGLYILDDGLWNSLATGKDNLTIRQAKAYCDAYIDGCLGQPN
jgi:TetR/AcrR family transcriptional repressor of bet genes